MFFNFTCYSFDPIVVNYSFIIVAEDWWSLSDTLMKRGTWNVERGTWNVERGTWNVECGTWNVERGTWNVERGTWSGERGTGKRERGMRNVKYAMFKI